MLEINSVYQVSIEENNIFSNGICHIDGQVVFVKGAVAEDLCKIKITSVQSRFAYAEITEIISPSSKRVESSCQAFGNCGGCCFLNIDIEKELEIKKNYLKNTFKKHSINIEIESIVSPVDIEYRNKVVYFLKMENTAIWQLELIQLFHILVAY
jgi:tRNA/tmRNA/rRNA uracil-C5-methylase (TrmA/RlmC/RlmD family)